MVPVFPLLVLIVKPLLFQGLYFGPLVFGIPQLSNIAKGLLASACMSSSPERPTWPFPQCKRGERYLKKQGTWGFGRVYIRFRYSGLYRGDRV